MRAIIDAAARILLIYCASQLPEVAASIWDLGLTLGTEPYIYGRHIYQAHHGPWGTTGDAFIYIRASADASSYTPPEGWDGQIVHVSFFHLPENIVDMQLPDIAAFCSGDLAGLDSRATSIKHYDFGFQSDGTVKIDVRLLLDCMHDKAFIHISALIFVCFRFCII